MRRWQSEVFPGRVVLDLCCTPGWVGEGAGGGREGRCARPTPLWEFMGSDRDSHPGWISQRLWESAHADPSRQRVEGAEAESVAPMAARLGTIPLSAQLSRLTF